MAEILVKNQICEACGADVRPQALFCYNCGGTVAEETVETENKNGNNEISEVWRRDNIEEKAEKKTQIVESNGNVREIETIEESGIKDVKPSISEQAKLKSAASLRRKAKSFQKREVEIVWEEPQNSSSVGLILIALLLAVFAAAVVILAMYLK